MEPSGAIDSLVRLYTPADYPMVCEWWKGWNFPQLPESSLPPVGLIVNESACAWLIRSDCNVAWLAYPISSKSIRGAQRRETIDRLIDSIAFIAGQLGFRFLHAMTNKQSLDAHYRRCGFGAYDQNITHYVKEL